MSSLCFLCTSKSNVINTLNAIRELGVPDNKIHAIGAGTMRTSALNSFIKCYAGTGLSDHQLEKWQAEIERGNYLLLVEPHKQLHTSHLMECMVAQELTKRFTAEKRVIIYS